MHHRLEKCGHLTPDGPPRHHLVVQLYLVATRSIGTTQSQILAQNIYQYMPLGWYTILQLGI